MKDSYPFISLVRFCRLLGITRQAYYQHFWHTEEVGTEQEILLDKVKQIRQEHPVIGGIKLYCLLKPFLLEKRSR